MDKLKEVFTITQGAADKAAWTKIGVAYVNKDNSLNVILDTIPLDGRLHIRTKREAFDRAVGSEKEPQA